MYTALILSVVVGLAIADVSHLHGYHYDKPITSYGVPSYTVDSKYITTSSSGTSGGLTTGSTGVSTGITTGNALSSGSSLGSTGTDSRYSGYIGQSITGSGINTGYTVTSGVDYQPAGQYQTGSQILSGYQYSGYPTINQQSQNYHTSSQSGNYQDYYNFIQSGPPQIFKHFYVHAAPEEPEPPKPRQPIVLPPKQKHYNIIFVKTPTPPAGTSQIIPIPQQTEEKTIVYVLVQKPEEIKDVVLPKFTPNPPSKPEVFFIKYDGKDNAHGVINNIVQDYQQHDSVTFNGIGVGHDELPGDNVIIHDTLSSTYGAPLSIGSSGQKVLNVVSSGNNNKFVSSTEGNKIESSSIGTNQIESSTSGSVSSGLLAHSGLGGFENTNEVTIGSSHTGSSNSVSGGKLGGSSSYQTVQIETNSIGSTGAGPVEVSSVGPTSTLHAIVTGNDISSTTSSSPEQNISPISTSLNVPFETYGPPHFKP